MKVQSLIVTLFFLSSTQAQNVGIGTATPLARLHVTDSSVVFSATGTAPAVPGNPPISGNGRRMMWYPDKAAFRVGYAAGTSWDKLQVGNYSFVSGYGSIASGDYSAALGLNNSAIGMGSMAFGFNSFANTDFSTAIGGAIFANGLGSTAIGHQLTANGKYSTALGYNNISKALGGTVVGMYNDATDTPNPADTSSFDRIFQVGNGYYDEIIDDDIRRNALTVLRNGSTGIGTTTPAASALLDVSSTTKGFLPPRMNTGQRNAIATPDAGLAIYNTSTKAFQVFNGTSWSSNVHYIGENYGGGIVFYVYDNGQHGLIAAPADLNGGLGIKWFCCTYANTRAKANGVGGGLKNTSQIVALQAQYSGNIVNAANICFEYSPTVDNVTYGDWYLPSKHELNLLYLQKAVVGGFANLPYWSSTEGDDINAWSHYFGSNIVVLDNKNYFYLVRAIRSF